VEVVALLLVQKCGTYCFETHCGILYLYYDHYYCSSAAAAAAAAAAVVVVVVVTKTSLVFYGAK
jgi:hypothetical protein